MTVMAAQRWSVDACFGIVEGELSVFFSAVVAWRRDFVLAGAIAGDENP